MMACETTTTDYRYVIKDKKIGSVVQLDLILHERPPSIDICFKGIKGKAKSLSITVPKDKTRSYYLTYNFDTDSVFIPSPKIAAYQDVDLPKRVVITKNISTEPSLRGYANPPGENIYIEFGYMNDVWSGPCIDRSIILSDSCIFLERYTIIEE